MPTYTRTATLTFASTRILFLKAQVRIALRRSMNNIDESTLVRVFDAGIEKRYIGQVDIYGLDSSELCRAQLKIVIDWDRHQVHIREGRETIAVPEKWMDIGAIEVDEMTKLFREFVDDTGLKTIWQITWANGVDVDSARQDLGTVSATRPTWRGKPEGINSTVSLADEMNIGCYFSG